MTTLLKDPRTIRYLLRQDTESQQRTARQLNWAPPRAQIGTHTEEADQQTELVASYFKQLSEVDADDRLDYLLYMNQNLKEENLKYIAEATDQWLNHEARDRMRAIARTFAENQQGPSEILGNWLTDAEVTRMEEMFSIPNCPDPILACCYALLEAHGVAHTAYFIQQDRLYPQTGLGEIKQPKKEIEEDLRYLNAK